MSLRTIGSIVALFVIGMIHIATVSTDALAAAPAGTTRLKHHHHSKDVHHSGQVQHGTAAPKASTPPSTSTPPSKSLLPPDDGEDS